MVAVGDVHGAYERFAAILRTAGVIDEKQHWAGGGAHFVQVGDVLDRGSDTKRSLDLLMRLEGEAKKAGGRVHALLGNHEVMNMLGDLRYVRPAEYEWFRTPQSTERLHHLWERSLASARDAAKQRGEKLDEDAFRKRFDAEAPLGFVERTQALSEEGTLRPLAAGAPRQRGRERRSPSCTAGSPPESAALGCDGINADRPPRARRGPREDAPGPDGGARHEREGPPVVPRARARRRGRPLPRRRPGAAEDRRAGGRHRPHRDGEPPHRDALRGRGW